MQNPTEIPVMVPRKIRDTDIVYSAVSRPAKADRDGLNVVVRFSLQPVLDSKPFRIRSRGRRPRRGDLRARAVYTFTARTDDEHHASCRSPGCQLAPIGPSGLVIGPDAGPHLADNGWGRSWTADADSGVADGWLDWLAEGEPGRNS